MSSRTTRKAAGADKDKTAVASVAASRHKATTPADTQAIADPPAKAPPKTAAKVPARAPAKTPAKAPAKAPAKTSAKRATKPPAKDKDTATGVTAPAAVAATSSGAARSDPAPAARIDPVARHRLIAEVAYARYAARGYVTGHELDDWLQAEADVDRRLLSAESVAKPSADD
jgi:hypothetical protein